MSRGTWRSLKREQDIGKKAMFSEVKAAYFKVWDPFKKS